jgi:hypothetical protein
MERRQGLPNEQLTIIREYLLSHATKSRSIDKGRLATPGVDSSISWAGVTVHQVTHQDSSSESLRSLCCLLTIYTQFC